MCDEAFSHVDELRRSDPIVFARRGDPYHYDNAALLRSCVQLQERAIVGYRSMLPGAEDFDMEAASQHA